MLIKSSSSQINYLPFFLPTEDNQFTARTTGPLTTGPLTEVVNTGKLPPTNDFCEPEEPENETIDHHLEAVLQKARVEAECEEIRTQSRLQAQQEAAAILAQARQEADNIMKVAQRNAMDIETTAREQGYKEGQRIGEKEVIAQIEPLREQFNHSIETLSQLYQHLGVKAEQDIVRLAIEIAQKIVRRQVSIDREITISLIRVALSRFNKHTLATIRLHPEDYKYALAHPEHLGELVELRADASISAGGCLIETPLGDVDARLEQQFAQIEQGLMDI